MTRKERELIKEAFRLIERELHNGNKVSIPKFGCFYPKVQTVLTRANPNGGWEEWERAMEEERTFPRWRHYRSFFMRMNPTVQFKRPPKTTRPKRDERQLEIDLSD